MLFTWHCCVKRSPGRKGRQRLVEELPQLRFWAADFRIYFFEHSVMSDHFFRERRD